MDVYGRYIYIFISLMDSNGVTGCERHKLITIVWHNIVAAKARTSIRLQFFFILPLGLPWGRPRRTHDFGLHGPEMFHVYQIRAACYFFSLGRSLREIHRIICGPCPVAGALLRVKIHRETIRCTARYCE